MQSPTVVIADDHPILLAGLVKLLEPDHHVIGTATDGIAAIDAAARLRPDLLIIDISMPRLNGLDAIRQVRAANPGIRIVVLTIHTGPSYVAAALEAGADGYVVKQSVAEDLIQAITTTLAGGTYRSPSIARVADSGVSGTMALTPRQRQVLQLLADGKSAKAIARTLNLSVKTVDFHKASIMKQCQLHTTASLVRFAIADGRGAVAVPWRDCHWHPGAARRVRPAGTATRVGTGCVYWCSSELLATGPQHNHRNPRAIVLRAAAGHGRRAAPHQE